MNLVLINLFGNNKTIAHIQNQQKREVDVSPVLAVLIKDIP